LKVRQGEAIAERDSVLFETPQYPFPLIATLLRAAQESQGNLSVLDYGGALGSSYYQCRDFLHGLKTLRWCIVEQPKFVACGQREFQNDTLYFYESVEASIAEAHPQVVLLSGVLQYLAKPVQLLNQLVAIGAAFIVIDRTPIVVCGQQVISVQHVPETINGSSYPVWLFNEEHLKSPFRGKYDELAVFDAVDGQLGHGALKARFKGFIYRQKDGAGKS
jgi:putative methyltransferase (TIGR04325 family)